MPRVGDVCNVPPVGVHEIVSVPPERETEMVGPPPTGVSGGVTAPLVVITPPDLPA